MLLLGFSLSYFLLNIVLCKGRVDLQEQQRHGWLCVDKGRWAGRRIRQDRPRSHPKA